MDLTDCNHHGPRFPVTFHRSLSFTDELRLTYSLGLIPVLASKNPAHKPSLLPLTDIVDDLGDVGDEPVVPRAVAVLPGVPGQVALQLSEEGIHQTLLPTLAVVALVVPHAAPEASLARIV